MKITPRYQQQLPQNNLRKQQTNPNFEGSKILPKVPDKVKLGAIAALFLLPTLKVVNNCTGTDNGNNIEIVDSPIDTADVKNKDLKVSASDKYLVLSTCREEDPTIRANLYLRQIPDSEMSDFVAKHGKDLEYTPTR